MNSEIIQNLRSDIDELDKQLMRLIEKRAQLVLRLSDEKKQLGMTDYDPTREQAIVERLYQEFKPTFSRSEIEAIFKPIFKASLRIQQA